MKGILYLTAFILLCLWSLTYFLGYTSGLANILPVLTVGTVLIGLSKLYTGN